MAGQIQQVPVPVNAPATPAGGVLIANPSSIGLNVAAGGHVYRMPYGYLIVNPSGETISLNPSLNVIRTPTELTNVRTTAVSTISGTAGPIGSEGKPAPSPTQVKSYTDTATGATVRVTTDPYGNVLGVAGYNSAGAQLSQERTQQVINNLQRQTVGLPEAGYGGYGTPAIQQQPAIPQQSQQPQKETVFHPEMGYRPIDYKGTTYQPTPSAEEKPLVKVDTRYGPMVRSKDYLSPQVEEQLYQAGLKLPEYKSLAISLLSPDVAQKEITSLATQFNPFATQEAKAQAKKDVIVSRELGVEEYEKIATAKELDWNTKIEKALAKGFLESPLTAAIPIGAEFKIGGYLAERGLFAGTKIIAGKAAARATVKQYTLIEPTEIFGKEVFKAGLKATPIELGMGAVFAGATAFELAKSKSIEEAIGKVGVMAIELPGAAVGYKGTEAIGRGFKEAIPTPREFLQFTGRKAQPIIEMPIVQKAYRASPEIIKFPTEKAIRAITREPVLPERVPSITRSIYEELPTRQAKTMLETTFKSLKLLEPLSESAIRKMYQPEVSFGMTREFGEMGFKIEDILRQQREDILLGSLATAKFVKGFREVRGKTPEGRQLPTGIGDIELASERADAYLRAGLPKKEIHGLTSGKFPFGKPGEEILTSFGEEQIALTGGRVKKPIRVKGIQYQSPLEQAFRKTEGMVKYLSRKTSVLSGKAAKKEYEEAFGGFSLRRAKDVPDVPEIIEALAKVSPHEKEIMAQMKKFREAESTKLYSGIPPEKLGEYGYTATKGYLEKIKPIPLSLYGTEKPTRKGAGYGYSDLFKPSKLLISNYPTSKTTTRLTTPSTGRQTYPSEYPIINLFPTTYPTGRGRQTYSSSIPSTKSFMIPTSFKEEIPKEEIFKFKFPVLEEQRPIRRRRKAKEKHRLQKVYAPVLHPLWDSGLIKEVKNSFKIIDLMGKKPRKARKASKKTKRSKRGKHGRR